ncbi:MAG: MFS transporter [Nitrososphaerales archaeon]
MESKTQGKGLFRGWLVAIFSFFLTSSFGIIYSYSDFFIPLGAEFSWSHTLNSTVPALALLVFSIGSVFSGYFAVRIGFRKLSYTGAILIGVGTGFSSLIQNLPELLILYGIVMPLGTSFVVIIASAQTVKWFAKRRGLAVGIMAAGSGFGTLVVPPLAEILIQDEGWRTSFATLGLSFFLILAISSFFMQTPEEREVNPYGHGEVSEVKKSYNLLEALSTRIFWIIYLMFFLGAFGSTMFIVHAIPYAATVGINELSASVGLSILGAGSLSSRLVIGLIADRLSRSSGLIISMIIQFVSLSILAFQVPSLSIFFLCCFGIGFGYGGYLADFIALTGDIFGSRWIQRIWGVDETAFGLGGLTGPLLAGILFDKMKSYGLVLEIATLAALAALAMSLFFSKEITKLAKIGQRD